jgi:precorrin-6B methylase 2
LMNQLSPHTLLQRIPEVQVRIDSSNYAQIITKDRVIPCGTHGLAVLNIFAQPISMKQALEKLKELILGAQDWMNLNSTILQLYRAGILVEEGQISPTLRIDPYGFDAIGIHIAMLNDRQRTATYLAAIREVVRPGDVVVDLGTGTGVLAIAAACAAASSVYAIEASKIGKSAQAIFEANGLADKITLVQGWSTQVSLPEKADVLISEIIGNEPLGEQVLEFTLDARQRLLKPNARLIPSRLKIYSLAVTIPEAQLQKRKVTPGALSNWQSWYGIDFSFLETVAQTSPYAFHLKPHLAKNWETLSEPIMLAEIDLQLVSSLAIDITTTVTASADGRLDGILVYFELELSPTTILSTAPTQASEDCHWCSPVWLLARSRNLQAGELFTVSYRNKVAGSPNQVSVEFP